MTAPQVLLVAAALWPALLATLWLLRPLRHRVPGLAMTMAWPALALAFTADATQRLSAPGLFTSMTVGIDPVGRAFLLLTALLWTVIGVHAHYYMKRDTRRASFTGFLLFTGAGNIGVTLSQDMLSFYLFFALMTFAAYGLVVFSRTEAALRAGRVYIVMAVVGEALVVAGLFALAGTNAGTLFSDVPQMYQSMAEPEAVGWLLLLGFGVKAGLVPLHMWLPLAHPVAPTPASALLSGALIKAGVLGWLRFLPIGSLALPALGSAVVTLGVLAALLAAGVGITQRDPKTVLAYSSVSQMGFLTVGVGAALLLPQAAPVLVLAVAVYALHHAPAKAALFLGAGLIPSLQSQAASPTRSAFARSSVLVLAAVPALVLAGAPLTSGAVAKAALKGGLVDVQHAWPLSIDLLLSIAALGTTLLMARFLASVAAARTVHELATGAEVRHEAGRDRAGELVPWLALIAASAFAALWLPYTLAPLGELPLATDPHYIAGALWPIGLGVGLAAAAIALSRRYPRLTTTRVPAGDVVALFEHGARAARAYGRSIRFRAAHDWWSTKWQDINRASGAAIDRGADAIERLSASPALGATLCVLAVLLFFMLRS